MMARSLLSSLALLGCLFATSCKGDGPAPIDVPLTTGDLVAQQSFYGELVPKTTIVINVPRIPRVDVLTIKTVLLDGAVVKKGDIVATFDTTDLEDNLQSTRTDLLIAESERAKVDHALTTERIGLELEQQRRQMAVDEAKLRLVEGVNLISELERKKAEVNLRSAEVELKLATSALTAFAQKRRTSLDVQDIKVKAARELVEENESGLEKLQIKAPADGVVFRPYVRMNYTRAKAEPGRVCRPGDNLIELPDLGSFEVVVQARPRDASRIQVGDEATVYIVAAGDRAVRAKVARKDSFATTRNERYGTKTPEGNLKEIAITLELLEDAEGMRPGGTVRAEVTSLLAKDALLVPMFAVEEEEGKHFATLRSGERRAIDIGAASATQAEVKKGLEPSDVLSVRPQDGAEPEKE